MHRYINCIAHNASECNLLIGETHAAVIDCGMAFCAGDTIRMVKNALNGRALDYIFSTHAHYDHVGALPYFRREWPQVRLAATETGAAILLKDTPRRVIREFSAAAAEKYGVACDMDYQDDVFQADMIIRDGDAVPLGGLSVEVLETPGHTRDSVCYFVPELRLLVLNETPGVLMPDGTMYPCCLIGFAETLGSIEKCRRIPYTFLSLPHRGVAKEEDIDGYFDKALDANTVCLDFILDMKDRHLGEDEMLDLFYQKYASEVLLTFQPIEAFYANARATIACTVQN